MYDVEGEKPAFDPRRPAVPPPRSTGSMLPVAIVLGFGAALVVGLIAVTGLAGLYIILALSAVLGFAAFHYVLWGWWLSNRIRQEEHDSRGSNGDA